MKEYKIDSKSNALTLPQNIRLKDSDSLIPKNLPTFIIGPKGIGKSTLISTILNGCSAESVYTRIFYVYADHVDSTIADACKATLIRIPLPDSPQVLGEYFSIKTKFMSYVKLMIKLDGNWPSNVSDLMKVYTDNVIDECVKLHNGNVREILTDISEFILKYSQPFSVSDHVRVEGLTEEQYDLVVIDDVAVAAPYLFPTSVNRSPIYSYLTICRHLLTGFIIAGQDLMQLPKYVRKEINTWVFFKVTADDLTNVPIKASAKEEIKRLGRGLKTHNLIIYNGVTDKVLGPLEL